MLGNISSFIILCFHLSYSVVTVQDLKTEDLTAKVSTEESSVVPSVPEVKLNGSNYCRIGE